MSEATLFKDEPEPPEVIKFDGYAVAFNALAGHSDEQWEIDIDTICETPEAAHELIKEWFEDGTWKVVKVAITAEELMAAPH